MMQKIYQFIYQKYPFTVDCFYRYGCMPLKKYIVCPAGNLIKNIAYFAKGFFLAVISNPSTNKQKEMQFNFEFPDTEGGDTRNEGGDVSPASVQRLFQQ